MTYLLIRDMPTKCNFPAQFQGALWSQDGEDSPVTVAEVSHLPCFSCLCFWGNHSNWWLLTTNILYLGPNNVSLISNSSSFTTIVLQNRIFTSTSTNYLDFLKIAPVCFPIPLPVVKSNKTFVCLLRRKQQQWRGGGGEYGERS